MTAAAPTRPGQSAELRAPAKLTLSLAVTGTRPDGYHLLESEMVTLDLSDTLSFEGATSGETGHLTISPDPSRPTTAWDPGAISLGPDNLVVRALAAVGRTARVHVVKRIPPGAGLGGGSADAAAVLRWAGCTDLRVAASLGADVPFCLTGGRAMVGGIGESVTPLPFEDRQFTLLLLPFGVDTGAVYRAWDELAGEGGRGRPGGSGSGNDLEAAAVMVEPRLGRWRARLEAMTGRRPHLAGSGSTWFVEGPPEEVGALDGQWLQEGGETGIVVAVRTAPPSAP